MEVNQFFLKNRNEYYINYDIQSDQIKMIGSYFWEKNEQQEEVFKFNDQNNLNKFKQMPTIGKNLLEGIDSFTYTETESILNPVFQSLKMNNYELNECQFITFRNNLNKIFSTPYSKQGWQIAVQKFSERNLIQLDIISQTNNKIDDFDFKLRYSGFNFEKLCINPLAKNNKNQEFCGIFEKQFGKYKLIIGAELDCQDEQGNIIELKSMINPDSKNQFNYQMKLLNCYIQSSIINTTKIVIGFRDKQFNLQDTKILNTFDIPNMTKKVWEPQICHGFGQYLLDFLSKNVQNDSKYICEFKTGDFYNPNQNGKFGQISLIKL